MNPRRLLIFQAVFNEPGLHLRALQRRLGVPLQSLRWHVSILVKAGILVSVTAGKKELLFTPLSAGREEMVSKAFRRNPKYGQIMELMSKRDTISVKELMRETGAYQQLVSARLKTLKTRGIVESEGRGPKVRYRMADSIKSLPASRSMEMMEELLSLLRNQGLAPKVSRQDNGRLDVKVSDGSVETELSFQL